MVTPRHETTDEIAFSILSFMRNSNYNPLVVKEIAVSCFVPKIPEKIYCFYLKIGKIMLYFTKLIMCNDNLKKDQIINF